MKEFKTELDKLLLDNLYSRVDIYPLIKSHNGGQNEIKSSIQTVVRNYQETELIIMSDESIYNLGWIPPTAIEMPDREIFATATDKFEQRHKSNNPPPSQVIHNTFTTHGDNSPIAGHDVNIGDIQSSSRNIDLNFSQSDPNIQPPKKQNAIIKAVSYIGDNIIVRIAVGLIIIYLAIKFGLKENG